MSNTRKLRALNRTSGLMQRWKRHWSGGRVRDTGATHVGTGSRNDVARAFRIRQTSQVPKPQEEAVDGD
jgi:hypothetical protein